MANQKQPISWLLLLSLICAMLMSITIASPDARKEYIVYMGDLPKNDISATTLHQNMVQQVLGSAPNALLYDYKRSFNGFVVKLTELEMQTMLKMEGVVSIFTNEKKHLHTTRSWDFMEFSQQVNRTTFESDVVIGMLDTGIWPESASFSDQGMGPPPTKWMGTCKPLLNFTCNNKIIGARYYRSSGIISPVDIASPRDSHGHGTHTASTAAGSLVSSASLMGLGLGTARGGVPSSRIAVYKICWSDGCYDADILAAFDDAIADGVDIISLSVGGSVPRNYFNDSIAIGSFHAMRNGILTSNSAGNDGPDFFTTTNVAPWSLSVAASTIDRKFLTKVQLGNNEIYEVSNDAGDVKKYGTRALQLNGGEEGSPLTGEKGVSANTFDLNKTMYPIVYGGDVPNTGGGFTTTTSRFCLTNSLDPIAVKGKIVLCDALSSGKTAFSAGAAGTIMQDNSPKDVSWIFPLPASHLDTKSGSSIFQYLKLISNPTATIMKSTEGNDTFAPTVASFSSRGPSPVTGDILKPDLTAPGVDILAAWSPIGSISSVEGDNRIVQYNLLTGTSMACPHATAVAAYVKSFYPTWSPAAIKSALMTTASPMTNKNPTEAEFAYGAGHINPLKALNPGLVYDADTPDYIKFLCGEGYSTSLLRLVTGDTSTCATNTISDPWDLNYPSFALSTFTTTGISAVFSRTVTNVGLPVSTYNAIVTAPTGLKIQANPSVLSFTSLGQKLSFNLTIEGTIGVTINSCSLVWDDGVHQVRSPIVVYLVG